MGCRVGDRSLRRSQDTPPPGASSQQSFAKGAGLWSVGAESARRSMGTKGTQRKNLSTLHSNTDLNPTLVVVNNTKEDHFHLISMRSTPFKHPKKYSLPICPRFSISLRSWKRDDDMPRKDKHVPKKESPECTLTSAGQLNFHPVCEA